MKKYFCIDLYCPYDQKVRTFKTDNEALFKIWKLDIAEHIGKDYIFYNVNLRFFSGWNSDTRYL